MVPRWGSLSRLGQSDIGHSFKCPGQEFLWMLGSVEGELNRNPVFSCSSASVRFLVPSLSRVASSVFSCPSTRTLLTSSLSVGWCREGPGVSQGRILSLLRLLWGVSAGSCLLSIWYVASIERRSLCLTLFSWGGGSPLQLRSFGVLEGKTVCHVPTLHRLR